MVNLYRLICSALCAAVLLFLLAMGNAYALVPAQTTSTWSFGTGSGSAPTPQEACAAGTAFVQAGQPSCKYYDAPCTWSPSYVGGVCDAVRNGNTTYRITIGAVTACPANSIPAGGSNCACSTGFTEINGACESKNEDRDQCSAWGAIGGISGGALVQDYRLQGNVSDGAQYCMQGAFDSPAKGCKVSFSRETFLDYGGENSVTEGTFSIASNASSVDQSCVVGDQNTPPKVPPTEKCKDGFTGTVNGVEVCINKVPDSGADGDKEDKVEETDTEKKTTKTDRNTDCKNGVCTTVTTTTVTTVNKTNGSSTTSSSSTTTSQKQDGFCKENPTSKLCADDPASEFGGSCKGGFKCEGDAIQCAIAQDQHKRACQAFDEESPESKLYADNKGKTGNQTGDLPGNETISLAGRIDSSDALGAGSAGVSDLNVAVMGQSITLPFSMINPYLAYLGYLLVAVSFLLAFRIVSRG